MRFCTVKVIAIFVFFLFCKIEKSYAQLDVLPKNQKSCLNDSVQFRVVNVNDTDATFTWQDSTLLGWNNLLNIPTFSGIHNDTLIIRSITNIFNGRKFRCIIDSAGLGIHKDTTQGSILFVKAALISPNLSSAQNICFGSVADTIRIIQYPSGGDSGFSYQWQKSINGLFWVDLVSAIDTFLAIDTFHHTTYFRVKASSLSGCGVVISDTTLVDFYLELKRPLLKQNLYEVCYQGNIDSLEIDNLPNGGMGIYHYQWQISTNTINWNNLANDTTYFKMSQQAIIDTTYYRVMATDKLGCLVYFSDTATIYPLSPVIKPAIFGAQTICFNEEPDTLKIITSPLLGVDVTYQWQSSINGVAWTDMAGKVSKELILAKNGATKFYRVKALWRKCAVIFTDSVLVSVQQNLVSGNIKTAQTICYAGTPGILSFQNLPSGGGESFTYQWQISTDSISFIDIPSATSLVYAPPSLTSTQFYKVKVSSVFGCGTVFTNIIRIKVYTPFTGSTINANDTICYNTAPDTLRVIVNPQGGNGLFSFQWQSSANGINWINISGQTTKKYKPAAIKTTTFYRLISISIAGCGIDTSNAITIKVWPTIVKARISSNQSVCYNTSADTLRVVQLAQGVNAKFSYQWQISNDGISWSDVVGQTSLKLFTGNLTATKFYRVVSTSLFGCGSIASDSVKIKVYAQLLPAVISNNQTVCYDSIPSKFIISIKPTGANELYSYQWQVSNDSLNFLDLLGATDTVLQMNKHIVNKYYRLRVTSVLGCGSVLSNIIRVFVYKKFEGAVIGNSMKICYGYVPTPLYMTQKPKGGSLSYTYQWQSSIDSINWLDIQGQTADTLPMGQLLATTYYRLINASTFSCGIATSNVVTIFSLKLPDTTKVVGLAEVCKNQQELYYNLENRSSDYSYEWSISKGTILTDETKSNVFITWDNSSGFDTIFVKQTNIENGCFNYMILPIAFKETQAPNITEIIRKSSSNILVSKDSSVGINYQWGFINKVTKVAEDIPNGTLRYVLLPHNFDTTLYIYYLKTWFSDCITTTYYNFNALSLGIAKNRKNKIEVYPNPTMSSFMINGIDVGKAEVSCFDVLGKRVSININYTEKLFEFYSNQLPGVYTLVIRTNDGLFTERIILKR